MAVRRRQEHWRSVFAEQRASGLNQSEFCRKKAISVHAYFWWKRELNRREAERRPRRRRGNDRGARERSPKPSLVPVRLRTTEATSVLGTLGLFEVVLRGGRVLRVPVGFHAEELRRIVSILEGEAC